MPANFTTTNDEGEELRGVAHASMISEDFSHSALFGPFMETLAKNLPEQVRSVGGDYRPFQMDLPQKPLNVTTLVVKHADGRLGAMVSPA